jgi:hypothetical protein
MHVCVCLIQLLQRLHNRFTLKSPNLFNVNSLIHLKQITSTTWSKYVYYMYYTIEVDTGILKLCKMYYHVKCVNFIYLQTIPTAAPLMQSHEAYASYPSPGPSTSTTRRSAASINSARGTAASASATVTAASIAPVYDSSVCGVCNIKWEGDDDGRVSGRGFWVGCDFTYTYDRKCEYWCHSHCWGIFCKSRGSLRHVKLYCVYHRY